MKLLLSNANGVVFLVGFAWTIRGVALWSPPAAYVVAGVLFMLIGAWPFLRPRKS